MAEAFSFPTDRYVLIGTIGRPHGLGGEVKLHLYSGQPENLRSYKRLVLVAEGGTLSLPLRLASSRARGKAAIVGLETIHDRTDAEQLKGMGVLVEKNELPEIGKDEYYYWQFSGVTAKTVDGRLLGRVEDIFSNGAQDILVLRGTGQEYLIPILKSTVVSLTGDELIIAVPPGLLEINSGLPGDGDE